MDLLLKAIDPVHFTYDFPINVLFHIFFFLAIIVLSICNTILIPANHLLLFQWQHSLTLDYNFNLVDHMKLHSVDTEVPVLSVLEHQLANSKEALDIKVALTVKLL